MANKNDQVPNTNKDKCSASKLHVHIQGTPENVVVGTNNAIVFFRNTQKDDDTNNNNIQGDVTSEIVVLSEKNEVKCKYKSNPGESTFITIGNNCDIVEIDINPELEQQLKETGEFQVTKGDTLVCIKWKNYDDWNKDDETYCQWKIRFIKLKDGKDLDTQQLEKDIFEKIVDENNNDLRDLVTELIAIHNARLQHIEMGCIQLVLSTQSKEDARRLEQQKDELKALLYRTIIPESIEIDLEFQPSDLSSEEGAQEKSLDEDLPSDNEADKVDIQNEIVKPQRANRVLSQLFAQTTSSTVDPDQTETAMIEKRSMRRNVGAKPKNKQSKEINPFNFSVMTAREPASSRQLMRENSEPIPASKELDIKFPVTAPVGFEGEQGLPKLEIINEECPRMPEPKEFDVAIKSSDEASSLAISTSSTSACSSQNFPILHAAIKNNEDVENVSLLLDAPVDVNEKDNTGNTALHLAVQCSNAAVVRLLLVRNADVNCENANLDHPLHLACVANKLDIVALLLEHNAPTHGRNVDGDTPLHLAIRFGSMETIDLLIQNLRYYNTKNKVGETSLHVAARYGIMAAIDKLVQAGVSIDLQNNNSESPLLVAVKSKKLAVCRALIDNGANVNCVDQHGDSPLHIAVSMYMDDIANLLLNQPNINVNIYNNERCTPVYHARGEIRRRLTMAGSSTRKGWGCSMM